MTEFYIRAYELCLGLCPFYPVVCFPHRLPTGVLPTILLHSSPRLYGSSIPLRCEATTKCQLSVLLVVSLLWPSWISRLVLSCQLVTARKVATLAYLQTVRVDCAG